MDLGSAFNRDRMRDDLARGKHQSDGERVPDLALVIRCQVECPRQQGVVTSSVLVVGPRGEWDTFREGDTKRL